MLGLDWTGLGSSPWGCFCEVLANLRFKKVGTNLKSSETTNFSRRTLLCRNYFAMLLRRARSLDTYVRTYNSSVLKLGADYRRKSTKLPRCEVWRKVPCGTISISVQRVLSTLSLTQTFESEETENPFKIIRPWSPLRMNAQSAVDTRKM